MSNTPTRDQLTALLGNCCPVPAPVASGTQEISLSGADFDKLVLFWKGLPEPARPRLRGLTISKNPSNQLRLILSASGGGSPVLFSVDLGSSFPLLHEVWPYAAWWEDELREFEGISIPERREMGGVVWQQS